MRAPFLLLIAVYSIAIIVMTLIPGIDDKGNTWHMSLFHAFYFVSFTATTIGFGEIPFPLTDGQRLWAIVTVYMTVVSWFYALGTVIGLLRDKNFRAAVTRAKFKRAVKGIHQPFYLICGYGETGKAVVSALTEEHYQAVVIERDEDSLNELDTDQLQEFVPGIVEDASEPKILELAGIKHPMCQGVIAVTASDATNLKIAISSKLLHPEIQVACRSELKDFEENMLSFDTEHVVNPFESFAEIYGMLLHASALHLLYDWLTGAPNTQLTEPLYFNEGPWILCGYGRLGREIHKYLRKYKIPTVIIDPDESLMEYFENDDYSGFIVGTGFDGETLTKAGAAKAAGIIAGTENDSNNLSIIMTAKAINEKIFIVARQNKYNNQILYASAEANLIMYPREIIARKIRALYLTPLIVNFLDQARLRDSEWANITISRLSAVVGESRPHVWTVTVTEECAPAMFHALERGRSINMGHLTQDPGNRKVSLQCVPLLLIRGVDEMLMPEDDMVIHQHDQILFCGSREVKNNMYWTLKHMRSLNYVMTYSEEPESYIWRKIHRLRHKTERRQIPR
jgi:Trk K+ transport system NAD-binding subunit